MNENDKNAFKQVMDMACDYYGKSHLAPIALKMYFDLLADRTIEQFQTAMTQHMKDPESGKFFPKVADLEKHLQGEKLTPDIVIAGARNPRTVFDVMCRAQISSYDLDNNNDPYYLRQRAQECIQLYPEWLSQAAQGDFSANLMERCHKHGVDPREPFREGLAPPPNQEDLKIKMGMIHSERKRELQLERKEKEKISEITEEQKQESHERLMNLVKSL